jgi:hypothetical protein
MLEKKTCMAKLGENTEVALKKQRYQKKRKWDQKEDRRGRSLNTKNSVSKNGPHSHDVKENSPVVPRKRVERGLEGVSQGRYVNVEKFKGRATWN